MLLVSRIRIRIRQHDRVIYGLGLLQNLFPIGYSTWIAKVEGAEKVSAASAYSAT
jgi:hypothetical protein